MNILSAVLLLALVLTTDSFGMCGGIFRRDPPMRKIKQSQLVKLPKLENKNSKVILIRDETKTTITMTNDISGEVKEFGLVIPIPTKISKKDIKIVKNEIFNQLSNWTKPKLNEHWDPSPCPVMLGKGMNRASGMQQNESLQKSMRPPSGKLKASQYGVKVEAHFLVGEYDIAILKAKKGKGLIEWLNIFHYNIPENAKPIINSYIKQKNMFFVAKVNYKNKRNLGFEYLRPLQMTFKTPKFMLPIRLGMINSTGDQELEVYALSKKGRIEVTNYRTINLPSGVDLPLHIKNDFSRFYKDYFTRQTKINDTKIVFQEFVDQVQNIGSKNIYKELGDVGSFTLSKLHFRYNQNTFPEDLKLQETGDKGRFSVQFNIRHRATNLSCPEAETYLKNLKARRNTEATNLSSLTGWNLTEIRDLMGINL